MEKTYYFIVDQFNNQLKPVFIFSKQGCKTDNKKIQHLELEKLWNIR